MKAHSMLFSLLLVAGCTRTSEHTSSFTVNTVIPAGSANARTEAWKVERMIESAELHDLAFARDPSLRVARIHYDVDWMGQRIKVSASALSDEVAFRAAQAYAKAATEVLKDRRSEFEIISGAQVEISPVSPPEPR